MFRSDIASKSNVGLENDKESETGDKRVKCEEKAVTETPRMIRRIEQKQAVKFCVILTVLKSAKLGFV